MQPQIFLIDAFTKSAFGGNPAAVVLVEEDIPDELCQQIAIELNQSDTAFIRRLNPGDSFKESSTFGLRWWTPVCEVVLCGHATLASAHALFELVGNTNTDLTFVTKFSGNLGAKRLSDGSIQMNIPLCAITPVDLKSSEVFTKIAQTAVPGCKIAESFTGDPNGFKMLILVLEGLTRAQFTALDVNSSGVLSQDPKGEFMRMLILTTKAEDGDEDYDYYSRVIDPFYGKVEDPATGAANSPLANYWSAKMGTKKLRARQCSKRVGILNMEVGEKERLHLSGHAVRVFSGHLSLP